MAVKTADPPLPGRPADQFNTNPPPLTPQAIQKLLLNVRLMSRHIQASPQSVNH
jgi:hypothetical protein